MATRSRFSVQANDSHTDGLHHRLRAISRLELLVNRGEVVLHCFLADVETRCDLWRRATIGDELEYFLFALGDDPVIFGLARPIEAAQLAQHGRRQLG